MSCAPGPSIIPPPTLRTLIASARIAKDRRPADSAIISFRSTGGGVQRATDDFCLRPLIDDPNSAEFERISNKSKAAVAKSKPLLEETYNDRNPNRFSESRKQPSYSRRRELLSIVSVAPRRGSHETPAFTSPGHTSGLTARLIRPDFSECCAAVRARRRRRFQRHLLCCA